MGEDLSDVSGEKQISGYVKYDGYVKSLYIVNDLLLPVGCKKLNLVKSHRKQNHDILLHITLYYFILRCISDYIEIYWDLWIICSNILR